MSSRPTWFRFVASILALTFVSAIAIAAIGPSYYPSLFGAGARLEAPQSQALSAQATIGTCDTAGPVEVESTGGTTTPTAYATLNDAFLAIIAATHTGSINIEICGNTTETASATLTASGEGTTSYTDVTIRPVGGPRTIEGTIAGAVIRLNGADNVTIDGRQGGTGTARDLTVRNNSTASATGAIWLSSVAAPNGASNNTIRNLEIAAGQTADTGTSTTFGIAMSGTALSATSNGVDNDNNSFIANRIVRARYGIMTRGTTTNNNVSPVVTDNIVGPSSFGPDEIGKVGIYMQADTGALVSRNVVQFVGGDLANTTAGTDRCGICIGNENWGQAESTTITSGDYTVTRNIVHDVVEERTFSAVGIRLGTTRSGVATNNLVANNFVYNIRANSTSPDQVAGIGYAAGHTDSIVFNSISLTGDMDPLGAEASTIYGNGIRVSTVNGSNNANLTLMNNSVFMDVNSDTATNHYYAITLPAAAYSFGTGALNNNNYYVNLANPQMQTGGSGVTAGNTPGTEYATLVDWKAVFTGDTNSIQANPLYFENTSDLHIHTNSPNVDAGVAVTGITNDIDGQTRPNGAAPDIGADEAFVASGSLQLSSATYSVFERDLSITITVTRTGGSNGAVTVDYASVAGGTATGGASCTAGVDYVNASGTLSWADLEAGSKTFVVTVCTDALSEPNETVNLALSNATGGATVGTPGAAVLTISNSTIFGSSVSVGSGEAITSLTNPGGLFEQINTGALSANMTVSVTSDLSAESGAIRLNQFGGGFTLTINPAGGARTISGASAANCLIDLNGADGVTIDGLNTGGNSLTIRNTDNTRPTVCFRNDASSNSVRNSTIEGGNTTTAFATAGVVSLFDGAATGNDNNTITANVIRDRTDAAALPSRLIFSDGLSASVTHTGTVVSNNQLKNFTSTAIQFTSTGNENTTITGNTIFEETERTTALVGIDFSSLGTNTVSQNTVRDLNTSSTVTAMTFDDAVDTTVSRNHIHSIPSTSGSGSTLIGIDYEGSSTLAGVGVTVVNNMISIVPAFSNDQIIRGLNDDGFGGTFSAYYNTVLVGGTNTGTDDSWACVRETGAPTTHTLIDNICFNNRTGGTGDHFAVGDQSNGTGTYTSNYNIFVGTGTAAAASYFDKGTSITGTPVDFVTWQAGTRDANSQASNPGGDYTVANMFVSAVDLHLNTAGTNPASNAGTPVAGITTDFDNNTRSGTTPEIGADEIAVANTPPTIMAAAGVSRQQGSTGSNSTIANVTDAESGNGAVTVTVTTANPSNGVTISNIVNTGGVITADIVAACGATNASFTLQASDGALTATDTLNVSVTPNTPPTLTYANATVSSGGSTMVSPATGPADNGTIPMIAVQSAGTYTGMISVNNTTGVVSISNAAPVGMHTITIRATDNCGSFTDATFTLNVQKAAGGPVTVTATAGTPGPTDYPTLKDAIDAINAGTHQGVITVDVVASTTETATSVLNSSGAGSALYTSIVIRPVNDGVSVAGPSLQGRGLIELNGADNVTIDGDNPNTMGTNRNLTIQNTAANTVTFTSVIRIAVATTLVNTADNNIIRNLHVLGSATGRNIGTATTTTGSENTTFGIFFGPGASTTVATNPPAAVTSVLTGIGAGATASNLLVANNNVQTAARAISINGSATTVLPGLQILNNSVGNVTAGETDQVTAIGITAQGSTDAVISGNTVWVEGYVASSAAGHGINVGVNSANISGATVENNKVNRVRNNNPATWSAFGINLGGGSNHVVRNNFVSGVLNSQAAGTGGFGVTFGAFGIRIASGTGHDVFHNSVHLYGAMPGAVNTNLTASFIMTAATQTGVDVRNNIFSNQITGGNPATPGTRHVAVYLPSGATATMNLTINNNAYFVSSDPLARLAQVGTVFGAGEYPVADFDPTATTPATNFRAYTSTLSAGGTNDNASFATSSPPPFTSNTDLHIPAGTATRLESGGAAVGVTTDIDAEMRNATTPDIGADEFAGNPPPANDLAAAAFVVPANGSIIPTGSLTPQARFINNGTATQTNVTVRFRIIDSSMMTIYNETAIIPSIAPLQVVTVTFPMTTISNPGAYTMQASVELAGDQDTSNDTISGTFNTVVPISGTVSVGTGQTYTSLTNPGGIFDALNIAGISSNVVINITSDLTAETGAVQLNEFASPFTITIKPSGAARTVSGTSSATTGLIGFNAADRVTIDGSLSGGTDRSLTVQSGNTATTGGGIYFASVGTNGSTDNTVKNVNVWGAGATTGTLLGITFASNTFGALGSNHDNNRIENNDIRGTFYGIAVLGESAANRNTGTVITKNVMPATGAGGIGRVGVYLFNDDGAQITENTIASVSSGSAVDCIGLAIGNQNITLNPATGEITNATIARNSIGVVNNTASNSSVGIVLASGATGTNNVVNNMVSGVIGNADVVSAATNDVVAGIMIIPRAGATQNVYHNSVSMTGDRGATNNQAPSFALAITADQPTNVVNNILVNSQTRGGTGGGGESYAIGFDGPAANANLTSNFNDLFVSGAQGQVGITGDLTTAAQTPTAGTGTNQPTLAAWQMATAEDANSLSVDPQFVSATDLHLQVSSPMIDAGTNVGVTTDFDGETRVPPVDIGADEIAGGGNPGALRFSNATYSGGEGASPFTVTVTRTGGTAGTVTVQYATSNGTATGGASCTAGIDYISTSGTLTFVDGDTSETFNVIICNDTIDEPNETINYTLSNPTGGAVLGTPSTAVQTIVDDDAGPLGSFSINDVRIKEGNAGAVNAVFTVSYTGPVVPVSVQYATANGTAIAGIDYLATSGTLTFNPLTPEGLPAPQTQTVTVVINSDITKEANETFFVNLSNPTNATIADGQGVGIIIDEDRAYVADFDLDKVSDFGVYRPSEGRWYVLRSADAVPEIVDFGLSSDVAVPGDYDGDGIADYAVFRPSTGEWYRILSATASKVVSSWGVTGDKPVQGDYDGDGKTDLAVFRPSTGFWWILRSSNGSSFAAPFGISTDRPVQGDYDGDAKTDLAVYRDGAWYIARSSDGAVQSANWGLASDKPVSGDFDGDGKFDLAIYRDGAWWTLNSLTNTSTVVALGLSTDIPAPADYDGDGTTDRAVFRPSTGDWYVLRSSNGALTGVHWGSSGDVPVPSAYIPQ